MSSAAAGDPALSVGLDPADPTLVAEASTPARAPRPWIAGVMLDTIGNWGARLGIIWISIIAFGAIFAPLLANSFPLAVKQQGRWSFPAFHYMTVTDVSLLVVGPAATLLIFGFRRRWRLATRTWMVLGVIALTLAVTLWRIHPPLVSGYEDYRLLESSGKLQWVLHAPIPFSPNDHLNDQFDIDHPFPWAPSRSHLLGTENYGEDILSVMIHACRIAMSIGFISTGIALVIGIVVGAQMGYFAGAVDLVGMRAVEVFSAIPQIYLLLTFCAVFERNIYMVMAIIGLTSWTENARFVRAEFLKLRGQDFVQAAVASGLPTQSVLFRHILPNALAPLLVSASFGVASAILAEAFLSFLGLGLPVDAASWGRLLDQAVASGGGFHWWLALYPGLAIFFTVFAYNLIGEAFRDAVDPKLRR